MIYKHSKILGCNTAASGCTQLLWMRLTLKDYSVLLEKVPLLCDNESAIKIAYNPVQHFKDQTYWDPPSIHSRSCDARRYWSIICCSRDQLADIFTKPLDEARFYYLRNELNIIDSRALQWYPYALSNVKGLISIRCTHGLRGSVFLIHWILPPPIMHIAMNHW